MLCSGPAAGVQFPFPSAAEPLGLIYSVHTPYRHVKSNLLVCVTEPLVHSSASTSVRAGGSCSMASWATGLDKPRPGGPMVTRANMLFALELGQKTTVAILLPGDRGLGSFKGCERLMLCWVSKDSLKVETCSLPLFPPQEQEVTIW